MTEALTEEEIQTILEAFLKIRGDEGATEQECLAVIEDAHTMRVGQAMLGMLLDGRIAPNYVNGEVVYSNAP